MLWYIDPGRQRSALAIFGQDRQLHTLTWIPSFEGTWGHLQIKRIGIEKPIVYPGMPQVDANDLMDLREVVGWVRGAFRYEVLVRYTAPEWKAQVKKPIHHARIWEKLTDAERALFPPDTFARIQKGVQGGAYKSEVHNLLDAAGIGLFDLKRTGRGGTTMRP